MLTAQQLRIFWTIAHSPSLTQAAKQLGITQPALSQQLARLERAVGTRLFSRRGNGLELTDAGQFLLQHGSGVLAEWERLEAGLTAFREGRRGRISIGTLASLGRALLPGALARARVRLPGLELDVHELSPGDALEMLYGRTIQLALLSETAVARDHIDFARRTLCTDAYVLAVPRRLELATIRDPDAELPSDGRRLLRSVIQFNFGTLHHQRIEAWFRRILGRFEVVARTRQYESALALVESGIGVALVPLLATQLHGRPLFDINLYAVPGFERHAVALFPSHHARLQPLATVLTALQEAAASLKLLQPLPAPPFIAAASSQETAAETPAEA